MGNFASSLHSIFQSPTKPCRLIMLGNDAAGKTTILYKLKRNKDEIDTTIPTIGLNVENFRFHGSIVTTWDTGGRDPSFNMLLARRLNLYKDVDGIIYVVDSSDPERLELAKDVLHRILQEKELKGKPLLIFCNKQDLPDAMPPGKIVEYLDLPVNLKWQEVGCVATKGEGLDEGLDWMQQVLEEGDASKGDDDDITVGLSVFSDESGLDVGYETDYDPTEAGGNLTLKNFSVIKNGTECPFAKSAILWGGSPCPPGSSLEDQARANVAALTDFVRQSKKGANLDGFCIELDDVKARKGGTKELGECVRRILTALSDHDPAGEKVMRKKYIGSRGWHFRFDKADFFITTFAPCYPLTSSRYAFGVGKAFLLLQPHASFGRHDLPFDTPHTSWDSPKTVRDKTRVAFRNAGRGYHIPNTTRYPTAEHIVRPLQDDGSGSVVRWWDPETQDD